MSQIGSLSFACKVVKQAGQMFLRCLIDLSTSVTNLNHHISLSAEVRADIHCWIEFLPSWNRVEFIQQDLVTSHSLCLFTDASFQGFGAVYRQHWFSQPWPASFSHHHINFLELFAILAAGFFFLLYFTQATGSTLTNKQILFYTHSECILTFEYQVLVEIKI